jgi:UDPglucose 6-dehydrogenase
MREAPAVKVIPVLKQRGAIVRAYDPQAMGVAKIRLKGCVDVFAPSVYTAVQGADALLILVEWDEFKSLDLPRIKKGMKPHPVFIDTRNLYDQERVKGMGFRYIGIGR